MYASSRHGHVADLSDFARTRVAYATPPRLRPRPRPATRFRRPSIIEPVTDLATRVAPARDAALRRAAPALLGYAAVRALGLLALALWSAARDKSAYTLLTARWDALWYTRVAELGYGYEVRLPNGDVHSNLAFFPLLPWLERGLAAVTPLSYADAGFVVSLLASLAAAWGIFAVADHVYGRRKEEGAKRGLGRVVVGDGWASARCCCGPCCPSGSCSRWRTASRCSPRSPPGRCTRS